MLDVEPPFCKRWPNFSQINLHGAIRMSGEVDREHPEAQEVGARSHVARDAAAVRAVARLVGNIVRVGGALAAGQVGFHRCVDRRQDRQVDLEEGARRNA